MKIWHVTAEYSPYAKAGGLGDAVAGLSKELAALGHELRILVPKYDTASFPDGKMVTKVKSIYDDETFESRIWEVEGGLTPVESLHPRNFFNRGCIYGCNDDLERFLHFCRIVADYIEQSGEKPDVIHIHDWPTAALAQLVPGCTLTIHNIAHQGLCRPHDLAKIGLKTDCTNLLMKAIESAQKITTVSPTYAREVLSPEKGMGLEKVLADNLHKFSGILNGIDTSYWNPTRDRYLGTPYSLDSLEQKMVAKQDLQEELKLPVGKTPLFGCVTRLVPQKGVELIKYAIKHVLEQGGQFVLLGSSPLPEITATFEELAKSLEGQPFKMITAFNEPLAHRIYAGADLFVVPSLFEPCGLTQIISLQYGTVPIVRRTGGLADTVTEGVNGFVFESPTSCAFAEVINRALALWQNDKAAWKEMQKQGMQTDHSWRKSAEEYTRIYVAD